MKVMYVKKEEPQGDSYSRVLNNDRFYSANVAAAQPPVRVYTYPSTSTDRKDQIPRMKAPSRGDSIVAPQRQRWICNICRKSLSSKRSYDEHMNIHNDSRPFACDHCDYAAASQMTLRRHTLRNHTNRQDWGYRCPYCSETYMEPASYQQHVVSRHYNKSATFGCPFIECEFSSKCFRHFREHLAKHSSYEKYHGYNTGMRLPYSMSDENLNRFLIDDEYGYGYKIQKQRFAGPIIEHTTSNGSSFLISSGQLGTATATRMIFEDEMDSKELIAPLDPEYMKEPIRLHPITAGNVREKNVAKRPSKRTAAAVRYQEPASVSLFDDDYDDKPPVLEAQRVIPLDADWIATEIEVPSGEPQTYQDGMMDMDLD